MKIDKIKSIKRIKTDSKKYDLEIEGNHNFFANGILVHNSSLLRNHFHARSLDSKNHPSRNWLKALHGRIKDEIPEDFIICGENLYAQHSLLYPKLPSYFAVFNMWEKGVCLSYDDTKEYCKLLGLTHVPEVWRGKWNNDKFKEISEKINPEQQEGLVVRVTRSIRANEWHRAAAKWVRKGHVQSEELWMNQPIVKNGLAKEREEPSFLGEKMKDWRLLKEEDLGFSK